jgi:hypothetical protein
MAWIRWFAAAAARGKSQRHPGGVYSGARARLPCTRCCVSRGRASCVRPARCANSYYYNSIMANVCGPRDVPRGAYTPRGTATPLYGSSTDPGTWDSAAGCHDKQHMNAVLCSAFRPCAGPCAR